MKELSSQAEDCLLLVHRMEELGTEVTTSGLARQLDVTDSTVTAMIQKLNRLQLLNYQARKNISLTAAGREVTGRLIRRHRLIETFLWVQLGYSLAELHDEAENLEHAVSDRFVEAIAKALGHPNVDPHGDPIPDSAGQEITRELSSLAEAEPGQSGKLARVLIKSREGLSYLERIGLYVGRKIEVMAAEHGGIVEIKVGNVHHALDRQTASQLFIEGG